MSILNEALAQNPEKFWCTDDDRIEWLFNFNVCKLTSVVQQGLFG